MSRLERLRPPGEVRSEIDILKEADEDLFSKFERTDFVCSLRFLRESVLETTRQSGQPATFLMTDLSARPFAYAIKELFSDQSQKPRIGFLPIDRLLPREIKISNRDISLPLFYLSILSGGDGEIEQEFVKHIEAYYSRDVESLEKLIDKDKKSGESTDFFDRKLEKYKKLRKIKIEEAKAAFPFLYQKYQEQCAALKDKIPPQGRVIIVDDVGHTGETALIVAAICKKLRRPIEYHMLISTRSSQQMKWVSMARKYLPGFITISQGVYDTKLVSFGGKWTTEISRSKAMKDYAFGVGKNNAVTFRTKQGDPFEKTLLRRVMKELGREAREEK